MKSRRLVPASWRLACGIAALASLIPATDSVHADDLYVAFFDGSATPRGRIEKFADDGTSELSISVDLPWVVTADLLGNIFATRVGSSDILKFDPHGVAQGVFATIGRPEALISSLAFDAQGILYAGANFGADTIERFSPTGADLGTFATISTGVPGAPFAIVFDEPGNLYTTDDLVVERFDLAGASLGAFATVSGGGNAYIIDLALDSSGNLYALTRDSVIEKFDAAGSSLGTILAGSELTALAIDENDWLYVSRRSGRQGVVDRYNLDGSFESNFLSGLSGETVDLHFSRTIPEPTSAAALCIPGLLLLRKRTPRASGRCSTTRRAVQE